MKIIRDTKAQLDEQDDSEEHLTTPSESVNDTIATQVTDESPQMAEESNTEKEVDSTSVDRDKTENTDEYMDPRPAIEQHREWYGWVPESHVQVYTSRADFDAKQQEARHASREKEHEAQKQQALIKTKTLSEQHSKLCHRMWKAKTKGKEVEVKIQEAEKRRKELDMDSFETEERARQTEKKSWEKRHERNEWNLRRLGRYTWEQEDQLQIKEERLQEAEKMLSEAEERNKKLKSRLEKADEDLDYES